MIYGSEVLYLVDYRANQISCFTIHDGEVITKQTVSWLFTDKIICFITIMVIFTVGLLKQMSGVQYVDIIRICILVHFLIRKQIQNV